MRHVLLCSLGLSPAVVTETLWAMLQPSNALTFGVVPIVCDVVHIVTTAQKDDDWSGRPEMLALLESEARDLPPGEAEPGYRLFAARRRLLARKIAELYHEHRCRPPNLQFECVRDVAGQPLADISTAEHNVLFAEHLMRTVLRYTRKGEPLEDTDIASLSAGGEDDSNTILHVSLAGGRKTMSSNAQAAVTIFGRIGDQLTHVLVSPDSHERDLDFWWPGSGGVGKTAQVDLVPVPFVPLQLRLTRGIRAEDVNFRGVQRAGEWEMADRLNGPAPITIDVMGRTVTCRNETIYLNEETMEALALLVLARRSGHSAEGYDGEGWLGFVAQMA